MTTLLRPLARLTAGLSVLAAAFTAGTHLNTPASAGAVAVAPAPHARRTHATNFLLNPLSAMTSRTRGSRCRNWLSSHRPSSRFFWSAVVTHRPRSAPASLPG